MVMSRASKTNHVPSFKEVLSSSGRMMSHRVYELPSLSFRERFGFAMGSPSTTTTTTTTTSSSGPLRVTIRLPDTTSMVPPPRRLSTRYTRSYTDDITTATAPTRRVRFELPPGVGATVLANGNAVNLPDSCWPRSRIETAVLSSGVSAGGTIRCTTPANTARVHDTGRYRHGTLPPTSGGPPPVTRPGVAAVLKAARDADEKVLTECLKMASEEDVNAVDAGGRTAVSYVAAQGSLPMLEVILQVPGVDVNKPDNEGNTPLHFAAQAGHADVVNYILSHCSGVKVDARNALGFTPLMKAALQGRTRCAKLLIFAGASPVLKDTGKGLRAEEWARFCGRFVCAEMILKISRHRLLDRTSSQGRWGSEPDLPVAIDPAKIQPPTQPSHGGGGGFKTKLKQAFRTKSNSNLTPDKSRYSSLVTQLTSAALCASTPVIPSRGTCSPGVRSLIRPLAVPKLHVTLVSNPVEGTERQAAARGSGNGSRQINLKKKK